MTVLSRIKDAVSKFTVIFRSLNRLNKLVLVILLVFVLLMYFLPHMFNTGYKSTGKHIDPTECLDLLLEDYKHLRSEYDAVFNHDPLQPAESNHLHFIGNGYIGTGLHGSGQLYVSKDNSVLDIATQLQPVVLLDEDTITASAFVTSFRDGKVYWLQALALEHGCVAVRHTLSAHRSRPYLLIQQIDIYNHNVMSAKVKFTQKLPSTSNDLVKKSRILADDMQGVPYYSISSVVPLGDGRSMVLQAASTQVPDTVSIPSRGVESLVVYTTVEYSKPIPVGNNTDKTRSKLAERTTEDLKSVLSTSIKDLQTEHSNTWNSIWRSGLVVGWTDDPSAPCPYEVNSTVYSVLSSTPHSTGLTVTGSEYESDTCFRGIPTIDAGSALWRTPTSESDLATLTSLWRLTLGKHGCANLVGQGVTGLYKALVLSAGGLSYSEQHLSLSADPHYYHRNMTFRRVPYKDCYLDLSIVLKPSGRVDTRVVLTERLDTGSQLFICDSGCLDPPVELSLLKPVTFAVKLTTPITSLLYLSPSVDHLNELRQTLHVRDVLPYVHIHPHSVDTAETKSDMPGSFWFAISVLIITFHVFLFILIYKEYWGSKGREYGPPSRAERGAWMERARPKLSV